MSSFAFVGKLPASKSILNRLLILQSFAPALNVIGESQCEDVVTMHRALEGLRAGDREIPVSSAGTVLRFMAFRAARVPGRHRLVGHPRLFARPQDELIKILNQLSIKATLHADALEIEGDGWRIQGDTLHVPSGRSSQFASGVLLNAWDLDFDLYVSLGGQKVSEGYWRMTTRLCERAGMKIDYWDGDFRVPQRQRVAAADLTAEIDVSSAFAVAGLAAVAGQATLIDFPAAELQPDAIFPEILACMGVPITRAGTTLKIDRARRLNGVAVNLKTTPDLFPVLAVLAALAEGESELFGAPHLIHKESDRRGRIADLIEALGRTVEIKPDGLVIRGTPIAAPGPGLVFDCDHDHRLAFAAAVLRAAGFAIEIKHPEVVNKSFPEFWDLLA